jgi:mannose/fructose/N-acetylgalactosamine-specific phosphotransferase system component IIB
MIELLRIDDKLIHAQVIWGWIRALRASCIIVANDEAAHDELRKKVLIMAVQGSGLVGEGTQPCIPTVRILSLEEAVGILERLCGSCQERIILVVSKPADAVFLVGNGVPIESVSVGWMSFFPGKKRILETVSVDDEDVKAFCELMSKGISVRYQASPSDIGLDMVDYI